MVSSLLRLQNSAVCCLHNSSHASVILNLPLTQQPVSSKAGRIYLGSDIKIGWVWHLSSRYNLQLQATLAYRHPESEAASGPSHWTSLKHLSPESSVQLHRCLEPFEIHWYYHVWLDTRCMDDPQTSRVAAGDFVEHVRAFQTALITYIYATKLSPKTPSTGFISRPRQLN